MGGGRGRPGKRERCSPPICPFFPLRLLLVSLSPDPARDPTPDPARFDSPGTQIEGAHSIKELCSKLKTPRKVILLVKAGQAVDDFIAQLEPHMDKGDIIIDGGNSHYPDSIRRTKELYDKGLLFVGSGVSGGEEGARYGPSLMPGGAPEAWPHIKEIFREQMGRCGVTACRGAAR